MLGLGVPRLLLHGLPDVAVADQLHAAGDHCAALHAQLRLLVRDVVDRVPDGGVAGPGPAAAGLDQHRHHPDGLLPDHPAQDQHPQGDSPQRQHLLVLELPQHGRPPRPVPLHPRRLPQHPPLRPRRARRRDRRPPRGEDPRRHEGGGWAIGRTIGL